MIPVVVMLKACNIPQLALSILRTITAILVQLIFDSLVYSQADAQALRRNSGYKI
jgi:hypothetical protein